MESKSGAHYFLTLSSSDQNEIWYPILHSEHPVTIWSEHFVIKENDCCWLSMPKTNLNMYSCLEVYEHVSFKLRMMIVCADLYSVSFWTIFSFIQSIRYLTKWNCAHYLAKFSINVDKIWYCVDMLRQQSQFFFIVAQIIIKENNLRWFCYKKGGLILGRVWVF